MMFITMLRCRQREKDASLKYYQNRLVQLKKIQKNLNPKFELCKEEMDFTQALNEVAIEVQETKNIILKIEAEIQNNNYRIENEENNLALKAAKAKERVMAARLAKLKNKTA